MSEQIERDIESRLKKRVEQLGGKCIKFNAVSESGIPDRIIILPGGRLAFVELKRPKGGRVKPMQHYQINKLNSLGCRATVVKNYDEIEKLLEEMLNEISR